MLVTLAHALWLGCSQPYPDHLWKVMVWVLVRLEHLGRCNICAPLQILCLLVFDPCCSEVQGMEIVCQPGAIPNISRTTVEYLVQFDWVIGALLTCRTQQSRRWAGAQSLASQPLRASSLRIQGSCSLSSGLCTSLHIPLVNEQWLRCNLISLYIKFTSMSNPVCFLNAILPA